MQDTNGEIRDAGDGLMRQTKPISAFLVENWGLGRKNKAKQSQSADAGYAGRRVRAGCERGAPGGSGRLLRGRL
jgi:hypothetical protein